VVAKAAKVAVKAVNRAAKVAVKVAVNRAGKVAVKAAKAVNRAARAVKKAAKAVNKAVKVAPVVNYHPVIVESMEVSSIGLASIFEEI
jgi:TATA-box binding protein (TBP) (component of TFIID and TFIIIB)